MKNIFFILFLVVLVCCEAKQSHNTQKRNKEIVKVDSCNLDLPFDEALFQKYYQEDTAKFVLKNKAYERLTNEQLEDSMARIFCDNPKYSSEERSDILGYALKRGMPEAFARIGGDPCFQEKDLKRLFYLKKSIMLNSELGYAMLSSAYFNKKNYAKSIAVDSIASLRGFAQASYGLYFIYSKGIFWSEQGEENPKIRKEFISPEKAKFYFERALEQKHPIALYERGKELLTSNRKQASLFLLDSFDAFAKMTDPPLSYSSEVIEILEKEFPKEWENYKLKNPKYFGR